MKKPFSHEMGFVDGCNYYFGNSSAKWNENN
jgi:hypothetical protein